MLGALLSKELGAAPLSFGRAFCIIVAMRGKSHRGASKHWQSASLDAGRGVRFPENDIVGVDAKHRAKGTKKRFWMMRPDEQGRRRVRVDTLLFCFLLYSS